MKPNKIEELAESFINGNISYTKAQLYGKPKLRFEVYEWLQENASRCEAQSFYKLILKG